MEPAHDTPAVLAIDGKAEGNSEPHNYDSSDAAESTKDDSEEST